MKYLAYFQPSKELAEAIMRQEHLVLPGSGLHSTLCFFYMDPGNEEGLITQLATTDFNPFEVKTTGFDDFAKDSLVLRLTRPEELLRLHKNIVANVMSHAESSFIDISRQYFGNNYAPHMTISQSSSDFDRGSNELVGLKSRVTEYTLAKKDGVWKEVEKFHSNK